MVVVFPPVVVVLVLMAAGMAATEVEAPHAVQNRGAAAAAQGATLAMVERAVLITGQEVLARAAAAVGAAAEPVLAAVVVELAFLGKAPTALAEVPEAVVAVGLVAAAGEIARMVAQGLMVEAAALPTEFTV